MNLAPIERTAIVAAEGLPRAAVYAIDVVAVVSIVVLLVELRRARGGRRLLAFVTGVVATALLGLAVVRPHRLKAKELDVAPRTVVLIDRSRSMALPSDAHADGRPRIDVAEEAVRALTKQLGGRVDVAAFGLPSKALTDPFAEAAASATPGAVANAQRTALERAPGLGADLGDALAALADRPTDPIGQIVVVSDGRVDIAAIHGKIGLPRTHAVLVGDGSPPDAAIKSVKFVGAAVAHQATSLRVEIACTGGLACADVTVTVRELRESSSESSSPFSPTSSPADGPRAMAVTGDGLLATGTATVHDGSATLELPITLERAGTRAIEVAISPPHGDEIPENDRRLLTVNVVRERVRILHIAGRPTYDVRALRTWLKSDAAIDVVSFFILRTPGDDVGAPDSELALIPFPVRELFTEYLPTFDAVLFQDFDASAFQMDPYLPNLAKYVEHGGGLIHVGGQHAFSAGGYAGSPLARVTPVEMPRLGAGRRADAGSNDDGREDATADTSPFSPQWTASARGAPILADLASVLGDALPSFPGTSVLGDVRGGAIALWVHPTRKTASGAPMPILAVGDAGDGRSIALGLDATRILAFSPSAIAHGGRAYDALWRGLIGWLMRDPRYEAIRARLIYGGPGADSEPSKAQACVAGAEASVLIEAAPIDAGSKLRASFRPVVPPNARAGEALLGELESTLNGPPPQRAAAGIPPAGAFALRMAIGDAPRSSGSSGSGAKNGDPELGALATRTIVVCERGGDEWADPRPDRATLETLTREHGGVLTTPSDLPKIPAPVTDVITLERSVTPILPSWGWSSLAVFAMSVHWLVRRRSGMA